MKVTRRQFIASSALLASVSAIRFSAPVFSASLSAGGKDGSFVLAASNEVRLDGLFGDSFARSVRRLSMPPIDQKDFVLADVNFNQKRIFTNFSGDISGRYIESASLTSSKECPFPEILPEVIEQVTAAQKPDGHFGADVDWNAPVDLAASTDRSLEMPILWGNGRLLLGLVAAYERFGNEKALQAAKKLGDFYIHTVIPRFCDPDKKEEYEKEAAGYAAAYVTCVFEGMEGLIRCGQAASERKYIDAAKQMADFHEAFDKLPVGHSHGSLSEHEALMLLFEETGDEKYFKRVTDRWEKAVNEGYVNPCGSVAEKFWVSYDSDEGCSEADWLRLNLLLWRATGKTVYLDFVERLLFNGWLANQWPSGGFGHRHMAIDPNGPFAWRERYAESYWCCSYHGILGGYELKECLAIGQIDPAGVRLICNFSLDFSTPIRLGEATWTLASRRVEPTSEAPVRTVLTLKSDNADSQAALSIRVPDWAEKIVVTREGGQIEGGQIEGEIQNGYWNSAERFSSGAEFSVEYLAQPFFEDRRFHRIEPPKETPAHLGEAVLRFGPDIMMLRQADAQKIEPLAVSLRDGAPVVPEGMTCFSRMTDEERTEHYEFVFDVTAE